MFRKTLIVTTALVAATSIAHANQGRLGTKHNPANVMTRGMHMAVRPVGFKPNGVVKQGQAASLPPHAISSNLNKDANAAYLAFFGWYGTSNASTNFTNSYSYYFCASASCFHVDHAPPGDYHSNTKLQRESAVPFMGKGTGAKSVTVAIANYFGAPASGTLAIYTNKVATSNSPCGTSGNGFSTTKANSCPGTVVAGDSRAFTASHAWSFSNTPCCSQLQTVKMNKNVVLAAGTKYWVVMNHTSTNGDVVIWEGSNTNFTSHMNGPQQGYNLVYSGKVSAKTYYTSFGATGHNYLRSFNSGTKGWVGDLENYSYEAQAAAFSVN